MYEPATNLWTKVTSMPSQRSHIAASTFVRNGLICVVGGATNALITLADVIMYNPATNQWLNSTPLPYPRRSPVAADISGRLVVTLGSPDDNTASAKTWIGT